MASHKIILGVTGGIAAYKAAELTRLLVKDDFDVQDNHGNGNNIFKNFTTEEDFK